MSMLQMTDISKAFFGVTVLDHVDFSVEPGEVHALLGENGAGKSTLMNILAGVYTRDAGTITMGGRLLDHNTVKASENAGIAFVHQELNLFNDLKVYENIFLRKEILTKFGALDKRAMIKRTHELFETLGVDIDPAVSVSELETSEKQLLEIAKALFADAKLLILDEPTTALNNNEIDHLFSIIRKLKEQGNSFIFISHKMNEIFKIADRYTVLRNGNMVQTGRIEDTTALEVTRMMVGNEYFDQGYYEERLLGEPILEMQGLCGPGFQDVDLTVRKGEVIGFTGLQGSGVSELLQALFGVLPITGGKLLVEGKPVPGGSIHQAMKKKMAMIASNRKENSVIPDFTLLDNMSISEFTLSFPRQVIRARAENEKYARQKSKLDIKANYADDLITSLSGGNQQKVILARWLNTEADVLLMDNPTQGIDVGAKSEIYRLILELAKQGNTILINTLEIPEVQKVADRCIVFYHGRIQAILERSQITEERVMLCATNAINASEVSAYE